MYDDNCAVLDEGSPPQVRGKLYVGVTAGNVRGITPAGAGKTKQEAHMEYINEDHPRRCGENGVIGVKKIYAQGSPPQVRGKPVWKAASGRGVGITPAGAGKTAASEISQKVYQDHPRRCGENR